MKKFGLILAGCLAFSGIYNAHSEDIGDVARVAARRASITNTTTSARQRTGDTTSRTNTTSARPGTTVRNRTTTAGASRAATTTRENTSSVSRSATNVVPRVSKSDSVVSRVATGQSRGATRVATTSTPIATNKSRTISRAATSDTITRDDVLSRDYSKCKKVFFDCMDEFCANKDTQLKRCACSSRLHEFDSVKKQLAAAEEKMQDFNQRLLTVNMDKEDAAALSVATEGEAAFFDTKDTSKSKKTLDEIASKLNTSFNSNRFSNDLNVLSWSLNMDSAFDSVDSLMGASTTSKTGTALFSAALPVCREMAAEVCSGNDASLAESGYLATIEQDCNTVAKTYKTQLDQARAKVLEGGALLDMSRLDIYQKRNSDDILTCRRKMLDMLTNSTVCGDDMSKCLDVTGQYIDPSTGEAFLTPDLVNIKNLLTRPSGNEKWSTVSGNATFVSFLNSKRKFLEPAMENCQDIADTVWASFIDDALSQIKLAQNKKLESVRQSCTTLTAQCLSDASKSIANFDARALSVFGITADITANAMCSDILTSCTAILESDDETNDWKTGITEITTTTSYETLMQTCRQVGRACIIQVCSSSSGNFGLCESIDRSTNRKSIINGTACWDEVLACVKSAGTDTINNIFTKYLQPTDDYTPDDSNYFYAQTYLHFSTSETDSDPTINQEGEGVKVHHPLCDSTCSQGYNTYECRACRLAESLWGNCEERPATVLPEGGHNMIKAPKDSNSPSLLYWFAQNTKTQNALDSCRDTSCGIGYSAIAEANTITCIKTAALCYEKYNSPGPNASCTKSIKILPDNYGASNNCQCCAITDTKGNCCTSGNKMSIDNFYDICIPNGQTHVVADDNNVHLLCNGEITENDNGEMVCSGNFLLVQDNDGTPHYLNTDYATERFANPLTPGQQCVYYPTSNTWNDKDSDNVCPEPAHWSVVFE